MVDAAFGKTVRIEVVESSVERISVVALLVRIAEDAFADKCVVGLVGLVDVEVSRQDSRQILASSQFFHLFLYEESALHTGFLADVVHVEIEEQKLETGIFAFEVPQLQMRGNTASQPLLGMSGVSDSQKSPFSTMSNLSVR